MQLLLLSVAIDLLLLFPKASKNKIRQLDKIEFTSTGVS